MSVIELGLDCLSWNCIMRDNVTRRQRSSGRLLGDLVYIALRYHVCCSIVQVMIPKPSPKRYLRDSTYNSRLHTSLLGIRLAIATRSVAAKTCWEASQFATQSDSCSILVVRCQHSNFSPALSGLCTKLRSAAMSSSQAALYHSAPTSACPLQLS